MHASGIESWHWQRQDFSLTFSVFFPHSHFFGNTTRIHQGRVNDANIIKALLTCSMWSLVLPCQKQFLFPQICQISNYITNYQTKISHYFKSFSMVVPKRVRKYGHFENLVTFLTCRLLTPGNC